LTRALVCLSRYGENLIINARQDTFTLSTVNSSQSAYCRFRYTKNFFSKYYVGNKRGSGGTEEPPPTTGQLLTKSLLSILKHKTFDKTVEKCELSIVDPDGAQDPDNEEVDSLESKMIVRLHCKHGVIKTHRLLLSTPIALLAPEVPDTSYKSQVSIGPKAVRDIIEHFPLAKGSKSDPQLVWTFGDDEVKVKSIETSLDAKGKAQLSTELTISAEEFEQYDICDVPTTLAFHLREQATIAFAEAGSLSLSIEFTDTTSPLYIALDGDLSDNFFVIAASTL
ncbi:hypothetical protein POSPLADRAFT_1090787, partial [Postia placenta MAD-698-R-SB12]